MAGLTKVKGSGLATGAATASLVGIDDNATSTAITIDASENVGIGVTPESDWGSRNVLQFGLGASISGRTGSVDLEVSRNAKYTGNNPTSTGKYINADQACMYRQNGEHSFHVAPSGTADAAITWTTPLTIANTGDVTVGTGNLVIGTSGKGIDFSADGNAAGMTSEVLDDYEEGTWTPVLSDGTNNATMVAGTQSYVKIGKQVTLNGYMQTSSLGSVSGNIRITGLPFTTGKHASSGVGLALNLAKTAGHSVGLFCDPNYTYITPTLSDTAIGTSTMTSTEWSADGFIAFSFTYQVA
jgi:hypothetical protein